MVQTLDYRTNKIARAVKSEGTATALVDVLKDAEADYITAVGYIGKELFYAVTKYSKRGQLLGRTPVRARNREIQYERQFAIPVTIREKILEFDRTARNKI